MGEGVCHFGGNGHDNLLFHPGVSMMFPEERFYLKDIYSSWSSI
jgi:hypothetical protein